MSVQKYKFDNRNAYWFNYNVTKVELQQIAKKYKLRLNSSANTSSSRFWYIIDGAIDSITEDSITLFKKRISDYVSSANSYAAESEKIKMIEIKRGDLSQTIDFEEYKKGADTI